MVLLVLWLQRPSFRQIVIQWAMYHHTNCESSVIFETAVDMNMLKYSIIFLSMKHLKPFERKIYQPNSNLSQSVGTVRIMT